MVGELDIYGVYFRAFAVFAAIVFVLQLAVKRLLDAHGIYRFVWHRALFDLALYVILLGVVTAAAGRILHLREGADVKIDGATMNIFASLGRALLTLVLVLVAIAVGWQLWSY